jgi:hypothetical protein
VITLRRPSKLEWVLMAANAIFLALAVAEFARALSAVSCSAANSVPGCYPWGAEGPAAGFWAYQSKVHYLVDLGIKGALLLFTIAQPFISAKRAVNIAALIAIMPAIAAFVWATILLG